MANPEAEDHYYLGVDLIVEGKTDEAISEYLKAIELDPNLTDALHGLTRAYFQKGELDNAVHYAKRIAEADPTTCLLTPTFPSITSSRVKSRKPKRKPIRPGF